jgi:hypothetical protein
MHTGGHAFVRAGYGVWLTDHVPARDLGFTTTEDLPEDIPPRLA